ncbi:NADase-type glycan-binding domain-containing protein [Gracilinema caldarium]|uniref:NAD glycohydrolase translocation F5/8 type C domain-containing protein n=1 Tax=Gracilinema caldarium (strain ATCC 51460 / DSM 7334 / H1) TaxID=744872 RepID=F8EYZ9_GRAC1|nr:hypothetical protein [Gracilinema caldarium]AEJ19230.1 hypothetical protein Spica_1082 [Gracilinema caldarium DSM 7334]
MKNKLLTLFNMSLVIFNIFGEEQDVWIFPTISYIQRIENYNTNFDFINSHYKYYSLEKPLHDYPFIVADNNYIYLRETKPILRIERKRIQTEADGFQTVQEGDTKWVIITGGGYVAKNRIPPKLSESYVSNFKRLQEFQEGLLQKNLNLRNPYFDVTFILPQVIKRVTLSSPFLEETIRGVKYLYNDDIIQYRWFYYYLNRGLVAMYFVNDPTPMVEGAPGNGVGLTIDIEFHIPSDNVVVLNGFVDMERRHLYKRNARMKKVAVQSETFAFEYEFEDYVHFAQIDFPETTNKVRLTVLEVFEGSHYDDLCISGLFTNPDIKHTRNSPLVYELLHEAQREPVTIFV